MKRRGRPPYPDVLTPRQKEVLELLRAGRSNPEIAQELGISRDGAKFHVSEIITRLGVTSRREAVESAPQRQEAPTARFGAGVYRWRALGVGTTLRRGRARVRCRGHRRRIAA